MDREGDSYELMADMVEHDQAFVIRLCHDRRIDKNQSAKAQDVPKLFDVLGQAPVVLEREVVLSARKDQGKARVPGSFPARQSRLAQLEVRARSVEFAIGNGAPAHLPPTLALNFVEVREVDVHEGDAPVLWRLVTTEPIDTPEQVASIVDVYRMRWLIEEFFKAIKTGCNYESLQLESAHSLLVALAIYCAVAWRLLRIRWMERHVPEAAADHTLTPSQMAVLKAVRAQKKRPLPHHPTARDVLLAIAALGGHLKNNGSPGWLTLRRGFDKLLMYEIGWWAAKDAEKDVIDD
jgi:hypothetical protein